ncbi:non-specific lipid transfer protein GPI-anchored 16 [Cornus florida]|uniref:non-specific lipid transfer protein GPI-anchored 16 n=1 Tax=Cornus florida TaxID=4283 RepID=UPI0028A01B4B|nr:non-specific lipid transfer protein GPI-anchored 16 [Cornus florida]
MSRFKAFPYNIALYATLIIVLSVISVNGQIISTPCTASMISSFTPCLNFITGSTGNGSSPNAGCCSSLKSLMSGSMDCACLIITGNIPFSLPINQTLALSLPRSCNGGVPIQCKASGVPLPAPGPALFVPTPPPTASSPFSPTASKATALAPSPDEPTFDTAPASPPLHSSVAPTATAGIRPVLTPKSASSPSSTFSPSVLIMFLGIMVFKCY